MDKMLQEEVKRRTKFETELVKVKDAFDRLQARYRETKKKQSKEAAPAPAPTDVKATIDYEALMRGRDEHIDQLQDL